MDLNESYKNADYIDGGHKFPDYWQKISENFIKHQLPKSYSFLQDIEYAHKIKASYCDIFLPQNQEYNQEQDVSSSITKIIFFIHGGFWLDFDKSFWSFMAKYAIRKNYICVIPTYQKCPVTTIAKISWQIATAIEFVCQKYKNLPVILMGHSAGGQLALRMVSDNSPLTKRRTKEKICQVIGISGIYDLRPLQFTDMKYDLHLDDKVMHDESPFLLGIDPLLELDTMIYQTKENKNLRIDIVYGQNERPAIKQQSFDFYKKWQDGKLDIHKTIVKNAHHFDVIEKLPYGIIK